MGPQTASVDLSFFSWRTVELVPVVYNFKILEWDIFNFQQIQTTLKLASIIMKINRGERELLTREKLSQFTYVLCSSKLFTFFHLISKIQYCSFHHPYFINKEISSEKLSNWFKGTQLNGNPYFESCFSGLWSSHSFQPSPRPGFSEEDFFLQSASVRQNGNVANVTYRLGFSVGCGTTALGSTCVQVG